MPGSAETQTTATGTWNERLLLAVNEAPILPEVFRALRSRILHPKDGSSPPRTVMVTSVSSGEGKSFVTANLGISLALGMDQYSLLVDCDLRRPHLAALFGMSAEPGLADYLTGERDLATLIARTSVEKLSLLASGAPPSNPAELLSSQRMRSLVNELAQRYEDRFIIFDTPPVMSASESAVLAGDVDAVILVVRQHGTTREGLNKVIGLLGRDRILGIVFNDYSRNFFEKALFSKSIPYTTGY